MPDRNHDQYPQRRSIRLKGYDYSSAGAYFVTIATHQRRRTLSRIVNSSVELRALGEIVKAEWLLVPSIRPFASVSEEFLVIMPDHIHAVIWLEPSRIIASRLQTNAHKNDRTSGYHPMSLASVVAGFKSRVTVRWRQLAGDKSATVWQRNYYETVIRNAGHLIAVQKYIMDNPSRWANRGL